MTEITGKLSTALADRYRIERHLGEGGMATVYLAEDLKHQRKVAVKVLRPELAAVLGAERFVQEITTTANLQHPHILPLFDSGEADGFLYYVMPFIDGETLRDTLNRETQLGIDEAVKITTEIADALDYAHRNSVIHRDIKPENILMHDGRPMVADFGIALAVSAAAGGRMTETGLSLGTPHYMSPEQATAEKDITNRSDIYSLGSVLYEMLTGEPPHIGGSAQAIIMKIVTEPAAPVTQIRKSVPPHIAAATAKSLEKLAADRFESARAFAEALGTPSFTHGVTTTAAAASRASAPSRGAFAVVAAIAVIAVVWAVFATAGGETESGQTIIAALLPPEGEAFSEQASFGALSPDGGRFAFVTISARGERRLWVRDLSAFEAEPLVVQGQPSAPFWSPDGQSLGFFTNGQLMRLDLGTAGARPLCDAPSADTGAWADDGTIFIATTRGIESVSADGGECQVVIPIGDQTPRVRHPSPLPDGRHLLFEAGGADFTRNVALGDLETGMYSTLIPGGFHPTFVAPNRVVFGRRDAEPLVYGQVISRDGSQVVGDAVALTGPVRTAGLVFSYTTSQSGALLYLPTLGDRPKLLVNRRGQVTDTIPTPGWTNQFARDSNWVVMAGAARMRLLDLETGLATTIVTRDSVADFVASPSWSPRDTAVVFGNCSLVTVSITDLSIRGVYANDDVCVRPTDWSSDGRYLIVSVRGTTNPDDVTSTVAVYDFATDSLTTQIGALVRGSEATLSPDMRWLAYVSEESGSPQIYVRPFMRPGRPVPISRDGGRIPRWRGDGRELFFQTPEGVIMASAIADGAEFETAGPQALFQAPEWGAHLFFDWGSIYNVSSDGQRFIIRRMSAERHAVLVQNWPSRLREEQRR